MTEVITVTWPNTGLLRSHDQVYKGHMFQYIKVTNRAHLDDMSQYTRWHDAWHWGQWNSRMSFYWWSRPNGLNLCSMIGTDMVFCYSFPWPEQFIYSDSDVRQYRESAVVGPDIEHRYIVSMLVVLILNQAVKHCLKSSLLIHVCRRCK